MSWSISIPFRHHEDSLIDVADAARELSTDEDRAVARQLVLGAIVDGSATTAGELIDQLEKATPAERRKMLDAARVKAGLESTEDIEFREHFKHVQRNAQVRGNDPRPARYAYTDTGGIVDLNERDDEATREKAREESRRKLREERGAQRALAAAEHAEHARVESAAIREASRDQFPSGLPG